jgi:hypothetical protein
MTSLTIRTPNYVPAGYRSWTTVLGRDAGGFGVESDDQYSMTYARGPMPDDKPSTLLIYRGPVDSGALMGTELHAGESMDIGVAGAASVYHDGMWAPGPGPEERRVGKQTVIHWERSIRHSVTVRTSTGVVGVRGPKAVLDVDELAKIARSLID